MLQVVPDYYKEFACIASRCRHSCCIGWEIDVDEETLHAYDAVPGELGQRLRACIERDGQPHFALGRDGRCPFLDGENLCEIISWLGEEQLCQICADHPRFRCELPDRIETGLGLCCEAAGRLILSRREPMCLLCTGASETEDEIVALRDEAIALLQDRAKPIRQRAEELLTLCGGVPGSRTTGQWAEELLRLERLEEGWTPLLEELRDAEIDSADFDGYMAERETEYEQLLVYLVYRHLAVASDELELAARAGFAVLGYRLLHDLGALQWRRQGSFSLDDQVELARRFSAELEYSEENLWAVLELLAEEVCATAEQA